MLQPICRRRCAVNPQVGQGDAPLLALLPPQQSDQSSLSLGLAAVANQGIPRMAEAGRHRRVMIARNAKSASDAMHSTVVRELGLRPWEYGWNRDTYVVGLLTRAAGGGLKHRGASLHFICGSAS